MSKFRNVLITDFIDTNVYPDCITKYKDIAYLCGQQEKAPSTGKIHWQLYCEFVGQWRITQIKKAFGNTVHIEVRRGSQKQAIQYCQKEETYVGKRFTYGVPKEQGKRNDLEAVNDMIKAGKTLIEINDEMPTMIMKYSRGIKESMFINDSKKKEFRKVKTSVYYGKTGTGKTKKATEENKDYFKLDKANNIWFDGYYGQKCLIIDDFYGWIPFGMLLNILDGYPLRLEIKGSFTWAKWETVIITSNKCPEEWYQSLNDDMLGALKRRISEEIYF